MQLTNCRNVIFKLVLLAQGRHHTHVGSPERLETAFPDWLCDICPHLALDHGRNAPSEVDVSAGSARTRRDVCGDGRTSSDVCLSERIHDCCGFPGPSFLEILVGAFVRLADKGCHLGFAASYLRTSMCAAVCSGMFAQSVTRLLFE